VKAVNAVLSVRPTASRFRPPHGVNHDLRSDDLLLECRQQQLRFAQV
jgi:hypothetical protein